MKLSIFKKYAGGAAPVPSNIILINICIDTSKIKLAVLIIKYKYKLSNEENVKFQLASKAL